MAKPLDGKGIGEGAGGEELREEGGGALDGACDELGEEADVGEEGHGVARWGDGAAVDVDGIAEGLEGVERDADGEDEVEEQVVGAAAEEEVGEGLDEEVVVFEQAEYQQVDNNIRPEEPSSPPPRRAVDGKAAEVGGEGGEGDEEQEAGVPAGVEETGGGEDEEVLAAEGRAQEPVDGEDHGQEEGEMERIEQHNSGCKDTTFGEKGAKKSETKMENGGKTGRKRQPENQRIGGIKVCP